jgi:8-oxo-dGTP pyrophosphatase MutT (NUDIX family)
MNEQKLTGAGIICYIDNTEGLIEELEKDYLFLTLEDKNNQYDFPKGGLNANESILDCAKREAYEEANITSLNIDRLLIDRIDKAHICGSGLVLFLAKLDIHSIESIEIKFNYEINDYEHKQEFFYLTKERVLEKLPFYLNKSLDWAYNIIKKASHE